MIVCFSNLNNQYYLGFSSMGLSKLAVAIALCLDLFHCKISPTNRILIGANLLPTSTDSSMPNTTSTIPKSPLSNL